MKKKKAASSSHHGKHFSLSHENPHESPIIKFGVVFIYVFGIMLFAYAVTLLK